MGFDDEQSSDEYDDDWKQEIKEVKVRKNKNGKGAKQQKKKEDSRENKIRYGPDGGFTTVGVPMPAKKKRRTRRKKKAKKKRVNLNDGSVEKKNSGNDDQEMSISKNQKVMSDWWKTKGVGAAEIQPKDNDSNDE